MATNIQKAPAGVPNLCSKAPQIMGKNWAADQPAIQMTIVQIITALARMRVGKSSEIISQDKGPGPT